MKTETLCPLTLARLQTVDVHAKEWFDRSAGNSYFSARVVLNYGMPDAETLVIPMQYGYGSHYADVAMDAIRKRFPRARLQGVPLWRLRDRGVIVRQDKESGCLKRDVEAYGLQD